MQRNMISVDLYEQKESRHVLASNSLRKDRPFGNLYSITVSKANRQRERAKKVKNVDNGSRKKELLF